MWECTYDLCHFILESQLPILGSVVLDLGCGSGLSGVLAAKLGASEVHFQDFVCSPQINNGFPLSHIGMV